jgi:nucleolar pre-ribosomal-associated protein 1
LSKCLVKFQDVVEKFREIALALAEDNDGQWSRRCSEVETEVRKRAPDFMELFNAITCVEPETAGPSNNATEVHSSPPSMSPPIIGAENV